MLRTTMGQLLVNEALPEDMRNHSRVLDKKGIADLLRELAQKYPDKYREVSHKLSNIGRDVATSFGGYTFGLEHLRKSQAGLRTQQETKKRLAQILERDDLTPQQRQDLIIKAVGSQQQQQIDDIYKESVQARNPLAYQVVSGSRGNAMNLASLLGSDMLYADHRDDTIPLPVTSSYSQGLKPVEYWAATYGARKGTMATKFATQDAGFLCLARGTLVRKPDGTSSPIETIKIGDIVLGADKDGKVFPVKVTGAFDNGPRDVWRYKFRVGKSRNAYVTIEATESHKVLAKMKRGRAGTMHGDKNSITVPTQLPLSRASTGFRLVPSQGYKCGHESAGIVEPYGLMLGLLLGDGCLTTNDITFSAADEGLIAYVNNHYADAGFELTKVESHKYEYRLQDRNPNAYTHDKVIGNRYAAGFRHRFRAWLNSFGLLGHKAHEKFIPTEVYQWQLDSIAELLAGLFETDGCISTTNNSSVPAISLFMTSKQIIETVRDLLQLKFGIFACATRRIPKENYANANHDVYGIVINDWASVHRFNDAIRLPGRKQEILDNAVKHMTAPTRADEFMYGFVAKEFLGIRTTYDIEVDHPDHLFVLANGAIVSNSKQLNQVAHRLMVVDEDDPRDLPQRGLPVDTDDMDNEGALLAQDVGPYKRNTVLTPKILKHLKGIGHDRLLVRSPLVGGSPDGGIYARDVGVRERGVLPTRGEQIGLTAAQALSEPLSQGQLSAKHSGGVAGQEKAVGGFAYINQLIQVPKKFKGGAAHAEHDGTITRIEPAPAGGNYVFVDSHRHYVPADIQLKVKKGDTIEAGDVLSEGFPNPAIVTQHKGVGEGKRYFVNAMRQAMKDAGMKSNRRNIEVLARGLINHVRLTDEYADHVPDDVVPYSTLEHVYEPRDGHAIGAPRQALGKYLEKPVLHYSIGTKIRPSVLKELEHFGVNEIATHHEPPPFQAEMIRGMYSLQHDPDWMTRLYGSGLKSSILDATHRGAVSDELGTSFVPGLSRAVDFGRVGKVTAPQAPKPLPPEGQPLGDPRKTTPTLSLMPSKPEQPKKTGYFSGLFKASAEQEKEAVVTTKQTRNIKPSVPLKLTRQIQPSKLLRQIKVADDVAKPRVDTTLPGNQGSSTAPSATKTVTMPSEKAPDPNPVAPSTSTALGKTAPNPINVTPMGLQPQTSITSSVPSTPPGQINPARIPAGLNGVSAWGQTQPYKEEAVPTQNSAPNFGGFTPSRGLLHATDDPALAARFVQGGGNATDASSGFGGELGAVTRFGSLFDTQAVATLTGGESYSRGQYNPEAYSDNLLSGQETVQPHGIGMPAVTPAGVTPPEQSTIPPKVPLPATVQDMDPYQIMGRMFMSPVTSPAVMKTISTAAKPAIGAVKKQIFKETEEAAAKAAVNKLAKTGVKAGLKKLPGIGWALEVYDAADTPEAELRQKFEDKAKMEFNLSNTLGHFGDAALNPGQNLRAATIAGQDVANQIGSENRRGEDLKMQEAILLSRRIDAHQNGRATQYPAEMIAKDRERLEQLYGEIPMARNALTAKLKHQLLLDNDKRQRTEQEAKLKAQALANEQSYAKQRAAIQKTENDGRQLADKQRLASDTTPLDPAKLQQLQATGLKPNTPQFEQTRKEVAKFILEHSSDFRDDYVGQMQNGLHEIEANRLIGGPAVSAAVSPEDLAAIKQQVATLQNRQKLLQSGKASDEDVYRYLLHQKQNPK